MLLSTLIIALVTPAWALPTSSFEFNPEAALVQSAVGATRNGAGRIARLAQAVNDAICADRASGLEGDLGNAYLASWDVSYDEQRETYTLAFSSPSPEDLLELLASVSPNDEASLLARLPSDFLSADHHADQSMILTAYTPYLDAVLAASDSLSRTIKQQSPLSDWISSALSVFGFQTLSSASFKAQVEIAGQGLGSAMALLTAIHFSTEHPDVDVRATLFSLPKVGDEAFGNLVDELTASGRLRVERLTSGSDPVPSLPPPHYGLQHPSSIIERHIGRINIATTHWRRGRIEDGYGPYEGYTIGLSC